MLVAMEGEISNFERLIELAKECGFKILLAAMPRNLKRAEAELAEILALASVEAAASLAEQITSGAPGVYILATSREPLCAKSERVHHDVDGDTSLLWMLRDVHGMTWVVENRRWRSATARAASEVEVEILTPTEFLDHIAGSPRAARELIQRLIRISGSFWTRVCLPPPATVRQQAPSIERVKPEPRRWHRASGSRRRRRQTGSRRSRMHP